MVAAFPPVGLPVCCRWNSIDGSSGHGTLEFPGRERIAPPEHDTVGA